MAISYFDVWKKRMENNGDIVQSRLNDSYNFINNNFKDDPSYKLAMLKKKDNTITDLDIRVVNIDTDPYKKKIYLRPQTKVDTGDYIIYSDDTYLALAVENNLISPRVDSEYCNHLLKFMIDGQPYSMLSVVVNNPRFTLGLKTEVAGITEGNDMLRVKIPFTDVTKKINIGHRFIINGQAWKATKTDWTVNKGLTTILLGEDSINNEIDNLELGIADYYTIKHNYNTTCDSSISVIKGGNYNLVYSFTDNNKPIDSNLITIENTSNLISVIKSNDGKITITGIDIGTGSFKVKLNLTDEVREFIVNFDVVSNVVPDKIDYKVTTSNGYTYRPKEGASLVSTRYVNGIIDNTLVIDYTLDASGTNLMSKGNITIVKKSNTELQIRNVNISTLMSFTLTITDKANGTVILTQVITLKGV